MADFRFCFFVLRTVRGNLVKDLLREDQVIEHYLAYETGESAMIALGMLAVDATRKNAEVSLCMRLEFKNEGIS